MNRETARKLAQRYVDAFNAKDIDALEMIVEPTLINQLTASLASWVNATNGQYHIEITHCVAEENQVSLRVTCLDSKIRHLGASRFEVSRWRVDGSIWFSIQHGKITDINELWGIPILVNSSKQSVKPAKTINHSITIRH